MSNSSKYRFLSLAVIAVMSIVLAACGGDSGGGGTTNMSNADLLKTAANNMKAAKSYTINVDASSAGTPVKMTGDVDIANKNSKLAISAAGMDISVVSIMSDTYLSSDGGKTFTKSDSGAQMAQSLDQFSGMWAKMDAAQVDKAKDQLKDGTPATETIDGVSTKHITADAKSLSSLSSTSGSSSLDSGTVDIWIPTDGSYVKQMKITGKTGGQDVSATIKWSNINSVPAITAPPPGN